MANQPPDAVYEVEFTASDELARAWTPQAVYVTVYAFDFGGREQATHPGSSRMATRAAIDRLQGVAKEESAWVVEAAAIDADGFYSPLTASLPFEIT